MLTLEMIFALLQGLPADHLDHLDRAWFLLAERIQRYMREGQLPYHALHQSLNHSTQWERDAYLRAFQLEAPVRALPDLNHRQKDALIALRYAGASSLQQLIRVLALDRSYTRRLLDALVEKGYAIKYFRRDGAYYLAITSPLSEQAKFEVSELMQAFREALIKWQAEKEKAREISGEPPKSTGKSRESQKSRESRESRESRQSQVSPKSSQSPESSKSTEPTKKSSKSHVSPKSRKSKESTESNASVPSRRKPTPSTESRELRKRVGALPTQRSSAARTLHASPLLRRKNPPELQRRLEKFLARERLIRESSQTTKTSNNPPRPP